MQKKPSLKALRLFICLALLASTTLTGSVISNWQYKHPKPHNQDLWKVIHAEGLYVMTGSGGMVTTSEDLVNFKSTFYPELISLDGLFYANGLFIATSRAGDILVSGNGLDWTRQSTGTTMALVAGTYADGRYVLVGQDGTTATSTDLVNWTLSDTGDDYWYYGVTYGNGMFVAVSFDWNFGQTSGNIVTSTNGVDWTVVPTPEGFPGYIEYYDVAYADGLFVTTGYFYDPITFFWGIFMATSPDGLTWTRNTKDFPETNVNDSTPTWLNMARYNESTGIWMATGDRALVVQSSDGLNWIPAGSLGNTTTDFNGIGFSSGGAMTVIVGSRGDIYTSTDLSDWERKFEGNYARLYTFASNDTQHIAFGNTVLLTEDGGTTWENVFTGVSTPIRNAVWSGDRYVIGGDALSAPVAPPIAMSMDGRNWTPATLPEGFLDCRDLAYANGVFVAIAPAGNTPLARSLDGIAWDAVANEWFATQQQRNWLSSGDGKFVAWSTANPTVEVAVSDDGSFWETTVTTLDSTYLDAAFGNSQWVFIGPNGKVATTTDFINWDLQVITFPGQDTVTLESVTYADGYWVIAGRNKSIWSSTDGINWDPAFRSGWTGGSNYYSGVEYDGSTFWVVGQNGDVLQAIPPNEPASLSIHPSDNPGQVLLQVDGAVGDTWDILYAPAIPSFDWNVLTEAELQDDVYTHPDAVSGNRFYILSDPEQ